MIQQAIAATVSPDNVGRDTAADALRRVSIGSVDEIPDQHGGYSVQHGDMDSVPACARWWALDHEDVVSGQNASESVKGARQEQVRTLEEPARVFGDLLQARFERVVVGLGYIETEDGRARGAKGASRLVVVRRQRDAARSEAAEAMAEDDDALRAGQALEGAADSARASSIVAASCAWRAPRLATSDGASLSIIAAGSPIRVSCWRRARTRSRSLLKSLQIRAANRTTTRPGDRAA